jgi:hypothetical protein
LRELSQRRLTDFLNTDLDLDFLNTDLDLGFTLVRVAEVRASIGSENFEASCEKAHEVVKAVSRLSHRVPDELERARIRGRANELEALLIAVEKQPLKARRKKAPGRFGACESDATPTP